MSKNEYKLSANLYGHSLDIRSLTVTAKNDIVSGSRDKTAKYWKYNSFQKNYQDVMTYVGQKNFVSSVTYLEPSTEYPDGLVITGGNDNVILIYKSGEPFATFTLKEHTNTVCCLSKGLEPNTFFSGSWDMTAKYWKIDSPNALVTFTGHAAAIWSIIQLSDSRVVTASADKLIGIWDSSGQRLQTLSGHTDCVRDVADFPELNIFLSVANDASIKVWNYSGENINTYYGHTNYIYSIARCKSGGDNAFVTSDEDRTLRYWENGVNTQTLTLPAQSIWCVRCLENGDIVTGSSDGVIRIFTRDDDRVADEQVLTKFNEEVNALKLQSMQEIGGVKVSDLPGKEALYDPGKRAGQMKMVRESHGVVAYTWVEDGDKSHWERIGDVMGGTDKDASGKTVYEGKPYDFVFTVDVEEGKPPLKLPYNRGDDVYQAAQAFLTKHFLPEGYLEQVVDFILKNSKEQYVPPVSNDYQDPFTGGNRYTPNYAGNTGPAGVNLDPFTGGSSYSTSQGKPAPVSQPANGGGLDPFTGSSSYMTTQMSAASTTKYFPVSSYRTFDMGDPNIILNKLKEFNRQFGGDGNTSASEDDLEELVRLCGGSPNKPTIFELLFKLLDWPDDIIFPVLDVVRMAVRNQTNNEIIVNANNGVIIDKLKYYIGENCKIVNNIIVSLRTICNLCVHEPGESLVYSNRFDILEDVTSLGLLSKNGQIALSTVLLNLTVMTIKRKDELGYSILAQVIPDIITKLTDAESHFRCYVAIGTLITLSSAHKKEVIGKVIENANFLTTLELHSFSGANEIENKRMSCVKQLREML